ncbi:unnamed protein product [Brassicogethes aeneus]|uniref:Uncharacterized protein n=1 Tax=Brassicogethes aeneus TaxID=1431903 RepID=A0A9P0B9K6_BRAAE|nr:unnamed protein product [Brassicogethes aeneus]
MGHTGYLFVLLVLLISCWFTNGWQTSPHQYHIQTDEGPERYFRYQTDSGQYRKEKRLEDGTVIGTYAWIDDDGILRQRDYIADNAGYRILKTKNVYVGRGVPVGEAVKSIKKYPASAGTQVRQRPVISDLPRPTAYIPPVRRPVITDIPSTTFLPPVVSTTEYLPPSSSESPLFYRPAEPMVHTSYGVSTTTSRPILYSTPSPINVEINPNSLQSISSTTPNYVEITQNSLIATTEAASSISPEYLVPIANNSVSDYYASTPRPFTAPPADVQFAPPNYNSIDEYNPYVHHRDNSFRFQNGPTYPIDRNGLSYNGRIGNGYDPQYQKYDGVSVTNDGFRYYIPRAYHEETTSGERRDGSFGYIDPFGIRRVIYYNTAPGTGFQHRKNNRYVGFQATPYDPRPY